MKRLLIVALCLAALLAATSAHAYAIYNHVDHEVCVATVWTDLFSSKNCKYIIPAHSTHNGGHGDNISHVYVSWRVSRKKCMGNYFGFSIPHGGYARIYNHEVKVYKHDGKHTETKKITAGPCESE